MSRIINDQDQSPITYALQFFFYENSEESFSLIRDNLQIEIFELSVSARREWMRAIDTGLTIFSFIFIFIIK